MKLPGFVGPTYNMDALTFDSQRCVNLYPILSETGTSKSVTALRSVPGYEELYSDSNGGPIRGAKTTSIGRAFYVSGFTLYEAHVDGTKTSRGTLNTATSRVSMADNGLQLMIVDGMNGYTYTFATDAFAEITDAQYPDDAEVVAFLDGYFIVPDTGTNNFYISALFDGTSWDALDFSNAAACPDNIVSLIADNGNLWLFGTLSTEVFQNTGNAQFPFERIPGAVIQTGCAAPFTVQSFDNTVVWLGIDEYGRGIVWKAEGYQARRISNQAIEKIIASATDFTESYAYVYHEQGHVFYVLQIRSLDTTLVYDGTTQQWHERRFHDVPTNTNQKHRGSCHFFFNQQNLIGDSLTGKVYRQSLDLYDFDGVEMQRERIAPHISDEKRNIPFSSFELDMETGVGLSSGQGSNPQVMMQYSDDGGRTWSNERWTSAGAIGKYKTRVRWGRCGSSRDRVFKVRYSEPTFCQINEAYINAT